jgi:hypothetical protein
LKGKLFVVIAVFLVLGSLIASGCTKTVTVTSGGGAVTITAPSITTTIPAVTVTLPGKVTTIPATTVTLPAITATIPPQPTDIGPFLPTTPIKITTHSSVIDSLKGDCLVCHGAAMYLAFPTAPSWDGSDNGSDTNTGFYYVVSGSIQDHTGRTPDICLTCHAVA